MNIHKFKYKESYILLDVNSSNVFLIDELVYDVLDYYPMKSQSETLSELKGLHPQKLIAEAVEDIDELIYSGRLYTKAPWVDADKLDHGGVKAMCLNIAHDCNLKCGYCFAFGGSFNMKKELMSFETAKAAIDFLVEQSKNRINLEVDFFGGEPLMNFDVLKKTVEYARSLEGPKNKRFRFTVTTNAVLLSDKITDYLNREMNNVVFSLDGRRSVNDKMRSTLNGSGSYDIIKDKILRAVASRGKRDYYVRATFTADNLDFSEDVKHIADLGVKNISAEPVVAGADMPYAIKESHIPQIKREYDKLAELYMHRKGTEKEFSFFHFNVDIDNAICVYKRLSGCGAGCDYIAVAPNGDIYPCHQFVGSDGFLLGNVYSGIVNGDVLSQFKSVNFMNKNDCASCWARYYCGGGCHANAYNLNGEVNSMYPIGCELLKKRLECALYIKCAEKTLKAQVN